MSWAAFFAIAASACSSDPSGEPPDQPQPQQPAIQPVWFDPGHGGMPATNQRPRIMYPVARGESAPLSQILKRAPKPFAKGALRQIPLHAPPSLAHKLSNGTKQDPVRQKKAINAAPSPTISFDGTGNVDFVAPPDTNGDVGPNHYVEWVNLSIAVYDKTGTLLAGPSPGNTPWSGMAGSMCASNNNGDPIVIYDSLADRWVFSQFAISNDGHQCIAVSKTPDPLGPYYTYDYLITSGGLNDYPKMTLWPDGYYLSVREFIGNGLTNAVIAFDRESMVQGLPAAGVRFDITDPNLPGLDSVQPSHLEGRAPPPAGAPNYIVHASDDEVEGSNPDPTHDTYKLWAMHVDWIDPTQSTLAGPLDINVPEFSASCWSGCVTQPNSQNKLDGLTGFTMYRLAYRNFGDHESLAVTHTTDVGGGQFGIRWAEIRNPSTQPELFQTGTFAPQDGTSRWMGSIAMDGSGNLAVGYTASSGSVFPSLRYAARLAGDPIGELSQGEAEIATGGSSEEGLSRWGDYSSMSIDETDDCTFWYAGEYMGTEGQVNWHTHIASFSLPGCAAKGIGRIEGTVTDSASTPLAGARVHAGSFSALTGADGHYSINVFPGTYDVKAEKLGYFPQTISGVAVAEGDDIVENFALEAAPHVTVHGFVYDATHALWPVYSKVTFSSAGSEPVVAFTDPETGYYEVTLFGGTDYTATVVSQIPGYDSTSRPVTPLSGELLVSFGLYANQATCDAPGYTRTITPLAPAEAFEAGVPPAGWTVENTTTGCASTHPDWTDGVAAGRQNSTGGTGSFAIADADACGPSVVMNTVMTSPAFDLSALGPNDTLRVELDQNLLVYQPGMTDAKIEIWNGTSWVLLSEQTANASGHLVLGTQAANGVADARLRITYVALDWEFWWQIDNLQISSVSACQYMLGGLIFGNVTDENTGLPVNGATVTLGNSTVKSFATPDDPNQADGFYWTWIPAAPAMLTATAPKYGTATELAIPEINGARRYDVALPAGKVRVDPTSLRIRVPYEGTASATLTLINDGGAPATVQWSEVQALNGQRPNGPFATSQLRVEGEGLSEPDAAEDLIHSAPTTARNTEVSTKLVYPTGLTGAWGIAFDGDTGGTWVGAIGALNGDRKLHEFVNEQATGATIDMTYDNVFAADGAYDSKTQTIWQVNVGGDNCIHEVDPVAHTVTGKTICPQFSTNERGLAYDPGTDTFYAGSWTDGAIVQFDATGAILRRVNMSLNIAGLAFNPRTNHLFVLTNDAASAPDVYVLDASSLAILSTMELTDGGAPAFGDYQQAGLDFDCDGNFLAVNQGTSKVVVAPSGEMSSCLRDLDWLSESPNPAVVPPHSSLTVTVSVDARWLTPGVRFLQLEPVSDTPYPTAAVPLAVTVAFTDVPANNKYDPYVHALAGAGIAYGCAPGKFCPGGGLQRSYYAVWGLRALFGGMYAPPPPSGLLFSDVAPESYGADFVEDIYTRGLMDGCAPGNPGKFCPLVNLTRGDSAQVFLRTLEGPSYVPPPATGTLFSDVPASDPNAAWIEEVAHRGYDAGCGGGKFCPTVAIPRGNMAVWIVKGYNLPVLLP
ncbi:MAG TPA: carboxypeptidase regulatory-like domain-containing protein [Kofleriaceae bacterium]|nr:carboxypeptidase regulatory-like domain-containing protein [Kofleriaceae bacterium]